MMTENRTGPLAGLRVLDLSRLLPGGYCTLLMADLGADVIKIEEPGVGDGLRRWAPYAATGESGPFLAINRGKRSVTINLKAEGGRSVLLDLVRTADVLVESFRPGVMARLGVNYDTLREVNPGLVYAAISGYGADGPYVTRAAHDINVVAVAGAMSLSGSESDGPAQLGLPIGDLAGGGLMALVAILAALRVRDRTGEGQFCDVSMTDGVLSLLSIVAGACAVSGRPPQFGRDLINGGFACYGSYACADGRYVAIGPLEPAFFGTLCRALDLPEAIDWQYDVERQGDLRDRLGARFRTRSRDAWVADLAAADVCLTPVNDVAEALADPALRSRGMVVDLVLGDGSALPLPGVVPRLSMTPGRGGAAPSALGADTDAVLAGLGRDAAHIADLRSAGAV